VAKITDEMIQEFLRLHRQGMSYRAIGRIQGVDPRTVKSRVDRASDEAEREHWESVSRQLDIRYLEEHHRILTRVSVKLLDIVQTEPMFARCGDDAEGLINRLIYSLSESCADLLTSRGAVLDTPSVASTLLLPDSMGRDPRERLGKRLWCSLMEHEPELKEGVDIWVKLWTGFQRQRAELGQVAGRLIRERKPKLKNISPLALQGLADAAIMQCVHGFDAASIRLQKTDEAKYKVFMGDVPVGEEFEMNGTGSSEILSAWQSLLGEQLTHEEARMRTIATAYEKLQDAVSKLEDQVDAIVLRGRPNGTCALCPAYGLRI